jgi:perosamine synthetase
MTIPVYQPFLRGNEKKYVNQCVDSSWISSKGEFLQRFEQTFEEFIQFEDQKVYATAVCNGTVALHLAMVALDLQPGDEVIVPSFTYIASVNTIVQAGATPVFVDSLPTTWQIDANDVILKITHKTKAIMAPHLYGHPCDMAPLMEICKKHSLFLIEDCAEAFGTFYNNQHVGTFGDIATFSFFGNKTITTGEGGMVVMKDKDLYTRAANLKNQGVSRTKQYWHDLIAYNYRMTNICAAIGLAQLEQIDEILKRKRQIAEWYQENLQGLPLVTHEPVGDITHSYWMCSILVDEAKQRDLLRAKLDSSGIETRPFFYSTHQLPMYFKEPGSFPVAESLSARGINLPSWPGLEQEQVKFISQQIREFFA